MNDVEFIRGDTPTLSFPIKNKSGEVIPIEDIDTLFLTCRRSPEKTCGIVFDRKKEDFRFEDNKYKVTLKPEDTQEITCINTTFYFDIEVTTKTGKRKTRIYSLKLEKDYTVHGGDNVGN